jgi:ATP-binding cassette subfamily B (MDR/TAP) protein 9
VCIDGIPVQELSADWLCRNVTVVSQEPTLFARSVRRNIIYGLEGTDDEPSQEDVEEAARLANAASFIESLPQGYETEVGERGIQLSGGQKQRVAIARALVRKPRILLLDVRKNRGFCLVLLDTDASLLLLFIQWTNRLTSFKLFLSGGN